MEVISVVLGKFMSMTIYSHIIELDFDDYDKFFLKFRNRKPSRYGFYTINNKPAGLIIYFKDKEGKECPEKITFKAFTHMITQCWDWGCKMDGDILSFKFQNIRYKIQDDQYIEFYRITNKICDPIYKKGEIK